MPVLVTFFLWDEISFSVTLRLNPGFLPPVYLPSTTGAHGLHMMSNARVRSVEDAMQKATKSLAISAVLVLRIIRADSSLIGK